MFPKKGAKYPFASSPTNTAPLETGNVDEYCLLKGIYVNSINKWSYSISIVLPEINQSILISAAILLQ
jgi:hypothetical protein